MKALVFLALVTFATADQTCYTYPESNGDMTIICTDNDTGETSTTTIYTD